jgi:cytochrome c2
MHIMDLSIYQTTPQTHTLSFASSPTEYDIPHVRQCHKYVCGTGVHIHDVYGRNTASIVNYSSAHSNHSDDVHA